MTEDSIRVLIVDDLPHVREGLKTVLRLASKDILPAIEVVGEAQDEGEAIKKVQALLPNVVLIDLEIPSLDGYEITRMIKTNWPNTRVIILSIHSQLEAGQLARSIGADEFLTKGCSYEVLLNAIRSTNLHNYSTHQENGGRNE